MPAVGVLMGDTDMVRALGLAGLRCVLVSAREDVARHSRFVTETIDEDRDDLVDALVAHAEAQPEPPVLYVQSDPALLLVSRHRDRLLGPYRATLPGAELVEDLADKARFQRVAERLDLRVPPSAPLGAGVDLPFPLVVKPLLRDRRWTATVGLAKAVRADTPADLDALAARLAVVGVEAVAQAYIPGPESAVVSYHVYRAADGATLGEFTGRKIRTRPADMGRSTAVTTTEDPDLRAVGRDVVERVGVVGPAKLDFKRDERGALHLLEINARFTLWVHPGALAGVNLAGIAHADLTGAPRTAPPRARGGVRWCDVVQDAAAVRDRGGSLRRWARFAMVSDGWCAASFDDPSPLLRGRFARRVRGRA